MGQSEQFGRPPTRAALEMESHHLGRAWRQAVTRAMKVAAVTGPTLGTRMRLACPS